MTFHRLTNNRTTITDKRAVVERIKSGKSTAFYEALQLEPPGTVDEVEKWIHDYDAGQLKRKVRRRAVARQAGEA